MAKLRAVIPVYNDWDNVKQVLARLNTVMAELGERLDVSLINDGSTQVPSWQQSEWSSWEQLESLEVLHLHTNRGQTHALVSGLGFIVAERPCEAVIILDGDGEDRPEDVKTLLEGFRANPTSIVVAERRRRNEGWRFRLFYKVFKGAFRLLTGRSISFGNFSVCPWYALRRLVHMPELINHYPAAIVRSRLPVLRIPIDRGKRLSGVSSFGFLGHLQHGFGALAVDLDRMMVRLMVAVAMSLAALLILIVILTAMKLVGTSIISGWTSIAIGLALLLAVQCVIFAFLLAFISLRTRGLQSMVSARAFVDEIASIEIVKARSEARLV